MRNQKGITLIALVITIIVLLILAGVSIAMLTGDNGLLNKTNEAVVKEKLGAAKDVISTTVAAYNADWYEEKYVKNTPSLKEIDAYIKDKLSADYTSNTTEEGCTVTVSTSSNTVTLEVTGAKAGEPTAVGTIDNGTITWVWGTKAGA